MLIVHLWAAWPFAIAVVLLIASTAADRRLRRSGDDAGSSASVLAAYVAKWLSVLLALASGAILLLPAGIAA